jgi:hypothetical protein
VSLRPGIGDPQGCFVPGEFRTPGAFAPSPFDDESVEPVKEQHHWAFAALRLLIGR